MMTIHQPAGNALPTEPSTVWDAFALQALQHGARVALRDAGKVWTYGALDAAVDKTAQWLIESGLRRGDRLMLVCENSASAIAFYFAATRIGAWPVVVNARLAASEIDAVAAHCVARRIVFTSGGSLRAKAHAERYVAAASDPAGLGIVGLSPLNETATPEVFQDNPAENLAALIYTTGTTGKPKGVMLSHRNLLFVARATAQARRLSAEDKVAAVLPLSHILGLTGVVLGSLISGAQLNLYPRFDPATVIRDLRHGELSVLIGTPSMYALLAEYANRNGLAPLKAPRLRLISSAGAPLDMATKTAAESVFGLPLHNGYGITECSPTITLTALEAPRSDCAVGRLLPGIEARLAGDGPTGELWVRSPGVMRGYYKAPEETAAVIDSEGWFRTGDLARVEDGNVFIVGRAREMIIRFGYNVYPAEIEGVLNAHPGVLRSAVMGRAQNGTEEIDAFVERAGDAQIDASVLADYLASRLAPYKQPSRILFVASMPMSAGGKILKSALGACARTV